MMVEADRSYGDRLRRPWRNLVERRSPDVARTRPDWPVRFDPCFARTLLDNAYGRPWGKAVRAGAADLAALNARSLAPPGANPPC